MEMPKKKAIEDVINLEVLMQLKTAFAMADKDGGGDLSCDEFVKAFMDILGKELGEDGLRQMFMKIDANADGTIDWDEFSSFMLLQNQVCCNPGSSREESAREHAGSATSKGVLVGFIQVAPHGGSDKPDAEASLFVFGFQIEGFRVTSERLGMVHAVDMV